MPEEVTINKNNPLSPSEDYAAMRTEGFKLIEQLGHGLWTDYNNSDPGITILEALIYAITDLGYRTGFDVKDLLAPANITDDIWKQIFYTAKNILPNAPLNVTDFRKLMIDTEGVRNAWLEPSKEYEVPVWVDYNFYESREEEDCACEHPEKISCMGKLGLQASDSKLFPAYKSQKQTDLQQQIANLDQEMQQLNEAITKVNSELGSETDPVTLVALNNSLKQLQNQLAWKNENKNELTQENNFVGEMTFHESKIVEFEGLYNVLLEYEENVIDENEREDVRQKVVQKLLGNRNLCEDFLTVNAVEYEYFGMGASVALEENADPDVVLAKMLFTIYQYFTPSVPFYTLQEMMQKGFSVDEIFEGPALQYGFIEDSELEKTDLFRDIRLSDIINELMDIEGLKAITYFHLPFISFDDNNGGSYFNDWVTMLRNEKKVARIQPEKSQVVFCKERDVTTYFTGSDKDRKPNRMLKLFSDLKTAERSYKLKNISLDMPVPLGTFMNLEDYYTVTDTLPMAYGVSERAELPANADEKRKTQALQLKGYLLFFEQLLHDYLLQLSHLKDIYRLDNVPEHTYFTESLTQLGYLKSLLVDVENKGDDEAVLTAFSDFLINLVETPELFLKRRNIFLNHFLARFGEDLSNYEAISRMLDVATADQELVVDKTNMLQFDEYKKISSERGVGYNYADPEFWDTGNISGSERRISRLLGFSGVNRRALVPAFVLTEAVMITDKKKQSVQKTDPQGNLLNVIKLVNPENNEEILLTSVEVKDGCCTEQLVNDILANADIEAHLKIQDNLKRRARITAGSVGDFWFELYDGPDPLTAVLLASSPHFDKIDKRENSLKLLQEAMKVINNNEGLHLVEHLLLRPRMDEVFDENNEEIPVSFLNICLQTCDLGIGVGEGDVPKFKKKVSRVPAEKCYDNMPWILEYLEVKESADSGKKESSILFQSVIVKDDSMTMQNLKFRRYVDLAQRVADLNEFGSEIANYTILSNEAELPADIRYGFIIHNDKGETLAQSLFVYNKRTKEQIQAETIIDNDIQKLIEDLAAWFGGEMDWYCDPNPCDNNEDPYSFRTTAVLPCWPKRFRDNTFKNLVEQTINAETPAHIHTRIVWLGISEMKRFEEAYYQWLEEISITEIPTYEKVNPLVDVLNTLRPCGVCREDCGHEVSTIENDTGIEK